MCVCVCICARVRACMCMMWFFLLQLGCGMGRRFDGPPAVRFFDGKRPGNQTSRADRLGRTCSVVGTGMPFNKRAFPPAHKQRALEHSVVHQFDTRRTEGICLTLPSLLVLCCGAAVARACVRARVGLDGWIGFFNVFVRGLERPCSRWHASLARSFVVRSLARLDLC